MTSITIITVFAPHGGEQQTQQQHEKQNVLIEYVLHTWMLLCIVLK